MAEKVRKLQVIGDFPSTNVVVDDMLSTGSTNPVQNKVIAGEVEAMKKQLQDVEITTGNIDALLSTI